MDAHLACGIARPDIARHDLDGHLLADSRCGRVQADLHRQVWPGGSAVGLGNYKFDL
jgi:hypothetical protein